MREIPHPVMQVRPIVLTIWEQYGAPDFARANFDAAMIDIMQRRTFWAKVAPPVSVPQIEVITDD